LESTYSFFIAGEGATAFLKDIVECSRLTVKLINNKKSFHFGLQLVLDVPSFPLFFRLSNDWMKKEL
jgi:hypothetical protein